LLLGEMNKGTATPITKWRTLWQKGKLSIIEKPLMEAFKKF